MTDLKSMIQEAVRKLCEESGKQHVIHPELGVIVKDGKPTHALVAFYKKLERKRLKKGKSEHD